jgi:hypothetical protein
VEVVGLEVVVVRVWHVGRLGPHADDMEVNDRCHPVRLVANDQLAGDDSVVGELEDDTDVGVVVPREAAVVDADGVLDGGRKQRGC